MPDSFGQETPQEAHLRVQQTFAKQRQSFANSNLASNPYALLGQSLGNIFGGSIRKTLDTRAARRSHAENLVETTGMSVQEAREQAKTDVGRDFSEVRRAKKQEAAAKVAQDTFTKLKGTIGVERAQAAAETVMAAQLRRQGFPAEATAMTMQADARLKAEELREMGVRKVKAELTSAENSAVESGMDVDRFNEQPIESLMLTEERLRAKIESSTDLDEINSLERQLGTVQGRIAKLNNISLSDADERQLSKGASSKVELELLDSVLLNNRLGLLRSQLIEHKGSFAATSFGRMAAGTAEFMEGHFGLDPGTIGADTLISDVHEIGGASGFVSAEIRHALTGAAMSAQEQPLLEPFLTIPTDSPSKNIAKIDVLLKYTQLDIATRQRYMDAYQETGVVPRELTFRLEEWNKQAIADYSRSLKSQDLNIETSDAISIIDEILLEQGGGDLIK